MQQIIENKLIEYLDNLPIKDLRETSRKHCRLYLETELDRDLSEYKQHIKSVLMAHVVTIKQRYSNNQQSNTHHDPIINGHNGHHQQINEHHNGKKEDTESTGYDTNGNGAYSESIKTKENSVISVHVISDRETSVSSTTNNYTSTTSKTSRKRKSYENASNHNIPSKRRRISTSPKETNNTMEFAEIESVHDHKDE